MQLKGFITLVAVALIVVCQAGAFAQTQLEMNEQAAADYRKADADLNHVYKALSSKIDAASREKLIKSEQGWIKFRDADTEARTQAYEGGSMRPMVEFGWMTTLTMARTKQLKDWLDEVKDR